jgi:hypothetical protein
MHELSYLKKQLALMIEAREAKIHNGNVRNMEEYKSVVGERTGLLLAISEIEDLLKNQEEIDNAE